VHHCSIRVYLLQKNQPETRLGEDSLYQGMEQIPISDMCYRVGDCKGKQYLSRQTVSGYFRGIILKCSGDKTCPAVINGMSVK
jgi:hypothetical protein